MFQRDLEGAESCPKVGMNEGGCNFTVTEHGGLDKIPVNGSKLPSWRARENEMQAYWWNITFGTQAWLHDMTKLEDCIIVSCPRHPG